MLTRLELSVLKRSLHGALEGSNDGIPYGALVGKLLLNPSCVSFDGSSDVPPEGALLGDPNEESGCGADSWSLFEVLIHCLGNHFWILQLDHLMTPMITPHEVHCLELHLINPAVGTAHGFLLRPA